jgi:hypothetical protein
MLARRQRWATTAAVALLHIGTGWQTEGLHRHAHMANNLPNASVGTVGREMAHLVAAIAAGEVLPRGGDKLTPTSSSCLAAAAPGPAAPGPPAAATSPATMTSCCCRRRSWSSCKLVCPHKLQALLSPILWHPTTLVEDAARVGSALGGHHPHWLPVVRAAGGGATATTSCSCCGASAAPPTASPPASLGAPRRTALGGPPSSLLACLGRLSCPPVVEGPRHLAAGWRCWRNHGALPGSAAAAAIAC